MNDASYAFLDCGDRRRLERLGGGVVARPAPAADWRPGLPPERWAEAGLTFSRSGGWTGEARGDWRVRLDAAVMGLRPAGGGQVGVFPEHLQVYERLSGILDGLAVREVRVLNLFAHTGLATLLLAARSDVAEVVHVDGAAAAVRQGRENALLSGLGEKRIRWLVDDAAAFMEREVRRGREYDAILADPPAFGRGGGRRGAGEWKLERDLPGLLERAGVLLAPRRGLLCLSCHSEGWTAEDVARLTTEQTGMGWTESVSLTLRAAPGGRDLPCGQATYARFAV